MQIKVVKVHDENQAVFIITANKHSTFKHSTQYDQYHISYRNLIGRPQYDKTDLAVFADKQANLMQTSLPAFPKRASGKAKCLFPI